MVGAGATDWIGLATFVTAAGGAVAAIVAAFRANKALKAANGINTELLRKVVELKKAVADPSTVQEQEAGAEGAASVGIMRGVVTVEPGPRELGARDRITDFPPV